MLLSVRGAIAATLLVGTALSAAPAFAQDAAAPAEITVTGSAAVTTDYRFRGVSQSAGDPAIQGGITVSHASGFYVGTWGSSIDLGSDVYGSTELDLFGGWTGEVSSGLTLDAGLLYYAYPGGHGGDSEFFEPYASVSAMAGPAKVKVGATYAWKQDALPSVFGNKHDNFYVYGNVDIAIPNTPLTVSGHFGYTDGVLAPSYYSTADKTGIDWSIGASATVYGPLSLGVSYIGVSGPSVDGYTDDAVVGTLTASF